MKFFKIPLVLRHISPWLCAHQLSHSTILRIKPRPQVMLVLYQLSMKILSRQFSAWKYSAVLHYKKSCRNADVNIVHLGLLGSKPAQ